VVIVDDSGKRHIFPEGFDPRRAAGIVAQTTKAKTPREPGPATIGDQVQTKDSATWRFLSGAGEMLNPVTIAKGAYGMVRHPLDTYESMVDQSAQQFTKAGEAYDRGGISEALGHTAAGVLPMVGPLAADIGEQVVSGDYAGAAGKTIGLLAGPKIAKEVIKAPIRVPAVRAALEKGAAARVADVMTPKASNQMARRMGEKATKIAPEILKENRGGWSRAAIQKQILGKLDEAEGALDAAADERLAARALDTQPIKEALREKRGAQTVRASEASQATPRSSAIVTDSAGRPISPKATPYGKDVVPGPNQPRVGQIDQALSELDQLGPTSTYEPLRKMRAAYDEPAKMTYNPSLVDDFLKKSGESKGAADVTAALRETLAKADPLTAEANARYALYRSASDILEAAAQIEKVKPKVGRLIMARLTATIFGGQAAGPAGAAAGFVLAPAVDSLVNAGFTTKLKTAQLMQAIAEATKAGNVPKMNNLTQQLVRSARVPVTAQSRQMERVGQE
jgi:hypothetical protein